MILIGFWKIILQNTYVELKTPCPFMEKSILDFHFDYLIFSLIAFIQKYFSNKAQDLSEYLLLSTFYVNKWLFLLSWYKESWSLPLFAKFLGGQFLFCYLQSLLWVTSWLTLQYTGEYANMQQFLKNSLDL